MLFSVCPRFNHKYVITISGQILISRTGVATLRVLCCALCVLLVCNVLVLVLVCHADPLSPPPTHPLLSVCPFETSPCVPAPRARVETHVRVVPAYTGTL